MNKSKSLAVEIAVQDVAGVRLALAAGADRVELCSALAQTGGLTPSLPLIEAAVAVEIPVHVLIRTRPGGFRYSSEEIALMCQEIRLCRAVGVGGVVIGAAQADPTDPARNRLDCEALQQFRQAAAGLEVTLHRVFDTVSDQCRALEQARELGIDRVLTSAGKKTAPEGAADLALFSNQPAVKAGLEIMAGGGIKPDNVVGLLGIGLSAIHASCSRPDFSSGPNGPGGGQAETTRTDPEQLSALIDQVRAGKRPV